MIDTCSRVCFEEVTEKRISYAASCVWRKVDGQNMDWKKRAKSGQRKDQEARIYVAIKECIYTYDI